MNEHDRLDRLLSHLAAAQPDDGFNQRTLDGIAKRRANRRPESEGGRRLWPRWSFASASVAGGLAAVCVWVMAVSPVRKAAVPFQTAAPAVPVAANTRVAPLSSPPVYAAVSPVHGSRPLQQRKAQAQSAPREEAKTDFAAPEAPLTAEERRLARVAHRADPVEVAALNPEEEGQLELRDRVAFERFFDPEPRPKKAHN